MDTILIKHSYYLKLFEAFNTLPFYDVEQALEVKTNEFISKCDYGGMLKYFQRMLPYIQKGIHDSHHRKIIKGYIEKYIKRSLHLSCNPEKRPLDIRNLGELRERFYGYLHPNNPAGEAFEWASFRSDNQLSIAELEQAAPPIAKESYRIIIDETREKLLATEKLLEHEEHKGRLPSISPESAVPEGTGDSQKLAIDEVLAIPRQVLDSLLMEAAMVVPDEVRPGRYMAKPTTKPWQWANVRAALQKKLLLAEVNDYTAAELFSQTYGAKVSRGTMQQRPQDQQNSKLKTRRVAAFIEFLDRLSAFTLP